MPRPARGRPLPALALGLVLLATGCATEEPAADAAEETGGHGYVAGAEELTEAQLRLSYLDRAGEAHGLDLLTGETVPIGSVGPTSSVVSDGRFLFATSEPAGQLTVIDSGTWTVDHGDHTHYYRAEPRVVGTLDWTGPVEVASSAKTTTLFSGATGRGIALDREALGRGELDEVARHQVSPHEGALLPLGDLLIATEPDRVLALDASGVPVAGATAPCQDVRGGAVTRVGVVVSCADGAVLATDGGGVVAFESIPYPLAVDDADRATSFAQRPGRPALAALAGDRGAWLLDSRARTWDLIETATPLVDVVAADDEQDRLVGLDAVGRVVVIEPATGAAATTDVLVAEPADLASAVLEVDADRTYVNVPTAGLVHEIDHADAARVARSFPTVVSPDFFAETGR